MVGAAVSTPSIVLVPHFGQKSVSLESFSPQFEQYVINTLPIKQIKSKKFKLYSSHFSEWSCDPLSESEKVGVDEGLDRWKDLAHARRNAENRFGFNSEKSFNRIFLVTSKITRKGDGGYK